jgi:hypothetical protein
MKKRFHGQKSARIGGEVGNKEAIRYYQGLDVNVLSRDFMLKEGAHARNKIFNDLWLSVGFQFRQQTNHDFEHLILLLGDPDLMAGTAREGDVAWLLHSAQSDGKAYDAIVRYKIIDSRIGNLWSSSVEPECSPARHMDRFDKQIFGSMDKVN